MEDNTKKSITTNGKKVRTASDEHEGKNDYDGLPDDIDLKKNLGCG